MPHRLCLDVPRGRMCRGAAAYAPQSSGKEGNTPPKDDPPPAFLRYFLAMCHCRLGDEEGAKTWFTKADEQAGKRVANDSGDIGWRRSATLLLLRQEASELLGIESNGEKSKTTPVAP